VDSGKFSFRHAALCDFEGDGSRFDKIFAINVNLFWAAPRAELTVVRKLLNKQAGFMCSLSRRKQHGARRLPRKWQRGFRAVE